MNTIKMVRGRRASRIIGLVIVLVPASVVRAGVWDVDAGGGIAHIGFSNFFFTVSGEPVITDVDVRIAAYYQNLDDPIFRLYSPLGTVALLMSRPGPPWAGNWQDTYLDDEAAAVIGFSPHNMPPWPGPEWGGIPYRPISPLSVFDGEDPNGVWRLEIHDPFWGDGGLLYKAGAGAPWGTAIGTQLIIIPEPTTLSLLALGGLALLRRRH